MNHWIWSFILQKLEWISLKISVLFYKIFKQISLVIYYCASNWFFMVASHYSLTLLPGIIVNNIFLCQKIKSKKITAEFLTYCHGNWDLQKFQMPNKLLKTCVKYVDLPDPEGFTIWNNKMNTDFTELHTFSAEWLLFVAYWLRDYFSVINNIF